MDLQSKIGVVMIILLCVSLVVGGAITSIHKSKLLGDILGSIVIYQLALYIVIQGIWTIIRILNY